MKQSELKQLIKPIIREVLAEMMLEMKFDQVISESISKALGSKTSFIQEQIVERPRQQTKDPRIEQQLLEKRRKMLDSMHSVSTKPVATPKSEPKNILESVLQDTEESGYEIADGNTNPELVSESIVEDLTNGHDYSKFF